MIQDLGSELQTGQGQIQTRGLITVSITIVWLGLMFTLIDDEYRSGGGVLDLLGPMT